MLSEMVPIAKNKSQRSDRKKKKAASSGSETHRISCVLRVQPEKVSTEQKAIKKEGKGKKKTHQHRLTSNDSRAGRPPRALASLPYGSTEIAELCPTPARHVETPIRALHHLVTPRTSHPSPTTTDSEGLPLALLHLACVSLPFVDASRAPATRSNGAIGRRAFADRGGRFRRAHVISRSEESTAHRTGAVNTSRGLVLDLLLEIKVHERVGQVSFDGIERNRDETALGWVERLVPGSLLKSFEQAVDIEVVTAA
jgi:hypothetical protein